MSYARLKIGLKAPTWLNNRCKSWPHLRDCCSNGGRAWLTISEVHHSHTSISSVGDRSSSSTAAKPALLSKKTHTHTKKSCTMKTFCMRHYKQARTLAEQIANSAPSRSKHPMLKFRCIDTSPKHTHRPCVKRTLCSMWRQVCCQRLCQSPGVHHNWLLPKAWEKKQNRRQKVIHRLKVRKIAAETISKSRCATTAEAALFRWLYLSRTLKPSVIKAYFNSWLYSN